MAKRTLKDVVVDESLPANDEVPVRKKSRKDKDANHVTWNTISKKSKISKEERKAANQAKREAREAKKFADAAIAQTEELQKAASGINGQDQDAEESKEAAKAERKAARKAARKAEKALLKKQVKLRQAAYDSDSASASVPASNSTSALPSNGQSSATSPEPAIARTSSGLRYVEDPALTALPQSDIDTFLLTHFITVTDPLLSAPIFRPIMEFSYLPITDKAQRAPFASFTSPTPIQAAAWPALLAGRDMIGVAETGSGKTLAFGVPCTRFITSLPKYRQRGIKAVIVSPTRELALQIHEQLVQLATPAGLEVVCVYGGVPKEPQIQALKTASIVVATPGRLNDLIDDRQANLSDAGYVVLDEADRMLDKGFEDAIRKIISCTSEKRQTLMFTATWPQSVRELAATFMQSPVKIAIGDNPSGELRANTRIQQIVEVVEPHTKETRLIQLLKKYQSGKNKDDRILVFCLYKKEATRIENFIRMKGFKVSGIHGDLNQSQRTVSLESFKQGNVPILVATDVAARGLDIPAVKLVVNVTFPLTVEDYVHRIGRTGRAGKEGLAITLFTEHDKGLSGGLINVLKAANQPVPEGLMKFGTTVKKKAHEAYGAFYKETDNMKKATRITFD